MSNPLYRLKNKHGKPRGNYLYRYTGPDGIRVGASTGTTVHKDALAERDKRIGAVAEGKAPPAVGRKLTFDVAAADLLNDYRINNADTSTADLEGRIRNHLTPVFGGKVMASIKTPAIRQYTADRLLAGASANTVRNELANLSRMFSLQIENETLHFSPHIPMPNIEGTERVGFFEDHEFAAVGQHAPTWLRAPMALTFYTGWRMQSEVMPIEWRQVDRRDQTIRLDPGTTKNGKPRLFPYGEIAELVEMIDEQHAIAERLALAGVTVALVFHDGVGKPLFTRGRRGKDGGTVIRFTHPVRNAWASACTAAKLPGKIPHDFRRTAARNYLKAGTTEREAMTLGGWLTRAVFLKYNVVNDADLRVAVAKVGKRAGGAR